MLCREIRVNATGKYWGGICRPTLIKIDSYEYGDTGKIYKVRAPGDEITDI